MTDPLVTQLHDAGVACRALSSWCSCRDGRKDLCETCWLDGPGSCDRQVIEALVKKLVASTQQTDAALAMVTYWKGTVDRLTDKCMGRGAEE